MRPTPPVAAPAVPAEFEPTARLLSSSLDAWARDLDGRTPVPAGPPVFGAHVLAANSNRGPLLLDRATLRVVDLTLDRLKQLGAGGATLTVSYPLLDPSEPRAADYLTFYETVARHVRDRGLLLSVEQHVIFTDTPFSSVKVSFAALAFDEFVARDRAMTRTILERLRPDLLTVLSEPDTFARLTGYRAAATAAGAAAMVERIVGGLPRGSTWIGAGTGSWLADAAGVATAFARSSLDYVALHIYPATPATLASAQQVVDIARAAGKPVVLDEAWLFKLGPGESTASGFDATAEVYRRDAFTFWSPLDERFLELVARFARVNGLRYVAPFWSTYFWGQVEHSAQTKDLPYASVARLADQAAVVRLRDGTFTEVGAAYGRAAAR